MSKTATIPEIENLDANLNIPVTPSQKEGWENFAARMGKRPTVLAREALAEYQKREERKLAAAQK